MLKLFESTPGTTVLSLRIGGPVATILAPIINPHNLFIEGWYVEDDHTSDKLILLSNDVRDIIPTGFVINDYEVLSRSSELIRLKDIIKMEFNLLGLRVTSENGTKYGKIDDYAFETKNMFIQKLYVAQPLIKNFSGGTLSIDRSQIIEVTNRRIIIEEPTEKSGARVTSPSIAG